MGFPHVGCLLTLPSRSGQPTGRRPPAGTGSSGVALTCRVLPAMLCLLRPDVVLGCSTECNTEVKMKRSSR